MAGEPMGPGISVVAVSGAADTAAGPELREAMEQALAAPDARLIVDLTGATFLDSAMLGALAASSAQPVGRGRAADGDRVPRGRRAHHVRDHRTWIRC